LSKNPIQNQYTEILLTVIQENKAETSSTLFSLLFLIYCSKTRIVDALKSFRVATSCSNIYKQQKPSNELQVKSKQSANKKQTPKTT